MITIFVTITIPIITTIDTTVIDSTLSMFHSLTTASSPAE
jgi:hypothetical protein